MLDIAFHQGLQSAQCLRSPDSQQNPYSSQNSASGHQIANRIPTVPKGYVKMVPCNSMPNYKPN